MPSELVDRIMAELPSRAARRPWWRSASLLAAAVGVALLLTAAVWLGALAGPPVTPTSTAPTPSASPSGSGYAPYVIAESAGVGTPAEGPRTVATPADCGFLADDWLRQLCTLTLTADWRAIPVAPISQSGQSLTGPAWWAALARAMIDGDPSFCFDGSMRTFDTMGHSGGGAPPPDVTPAPIHPVAECLAYVRSTAIKGSFAVTDQGPGVTNGAAHQSGPSVTFTVSGQAVERSAQGVAPAFDPAGGCVEVTRTVCDQVLAALGDALGSRLSTITEVEVVGQVVGCPGAAGGYPPPSSCPPPPGGTWIGGVIAGGGGALPQVVVAFDIAEVGREISLVEVPYHRP